MSRSRTWNARRDPDDLVGLTDSLALAFLRQL
jgi:hypothetical protein